MPTPVAPLLFLFLFLELKKVQETGGVHLMSPWMWTSLKRSVLKVLGIIRVGGLVMTPNTRGKFGA